MKVKSSPHGEINEQEDVVGNQSGIRVDERITRQLEEPKKFVPVALPTPTKYTVLALPMTEQTPEYMKLYTAFMDSIYRRIIKFEYQLDILVHYGTMGLFLLAAIIWAFLGFKALVVPALWLQGSLGGPLHLFKRNADEFDMEHWLSKLRRFDFDEGRWLSELPVMASLQESVNLMANGTV